MPNLDLVTIVKVVLLVFFLVALFAVVVSEVGIPLVQLGQEAAEVAVKGQDNGTNPIPLSSIAELWSVFGVGLLFGDAWEVVGPMISVGVVAVILAVLAFKLLRSVLSS